MQPDLPSRLAMPDWLALADEARLAARSLAGRAAGTLDPTLRLGVTGLSRAGKTVFITALVHALTAGGRFPVFRASAEGRIAGAALRPQPDDTVPRFEVEAHLADLSGENRRWPDSTRQIAELRLEIEVRPGPRPLHRSLPGLVGLGPRTRLTLDIVDYPGEWLLDLPLLGTSYEAWSAETVRASRTGSRLALAGPWHASLAALRPEAPALESEAREAAAVFTAYLRAGRAERYALSTLPPGRFLMPGDLEGSPALTFAPLDLAPGAVAAKGSLHAMMERRFEAYKRHVVRPFFTGHFARLDRQVVLVDALAALNAGPGAVRDLEAALSAVLGAFRVGANGWLAGLVRPRIDRILFAATKADHLHHTSHDRLEAVLRHLTEGAIGRARHAGAKVDVVALAAVRATREASVRQGRDELPCILGTPLAGETAGGEAFDGRTEVAVFPGELPADPAAVTREGAFAGLEAADGSGTDYRFLRFRPPDVAAGAPLPHIRLDRALEFLLGDRLA